MKQAKTVIQRLFGLIVRWKPWNLFELERLHAFTLFFPLKKL
jgi:hypothetical protein